MSNSVGPHRWQPTRLPRPWDSPGKNTGVGCHFLLQCMKVKSESEVAQSCPTLSNPLDYSLPGPPSMGFSRQEYWSGVPLPSPTHMLVNNNPPYLKMSLFASVFSKGCFCQRQNFKLTGNFSFSLFFYFRTLKMSLHIFCLVL